MVDRAVADARVVHAADDLLKGVQVLGRVAVQLDVGDVAGVGQLVVGRLELDLAEGGDREVDRDVERVGVVLAVRDPRDHAVALAVHLDKAAGQALGRGGQERVVEVGLLALGVQARAHVADDVQAQVLGALALAVVLADEGDQALGKADEAHGHGAVLEHLAQRLVRVELFGVDPHALAHQEGEVAHGLVGDDLKALVELVDDQIHLAVQVLEEDLDVALRLDGQARQVDGGEAQVAAAVADLAGRVVDVADDARAAAHVGDLRLRTVGIVVLEVERRVLEGEVREQALGADPAGELKQVVVRLAGVVVDALLDAEDLDREDRGLAVAQARLRGQQHVAHDHAALGRNVHAVVDGREGDLRARAGVHGVQVVDQGLHRLVGGAVRLLFGVGLGKVLHLVDEVRIQALREQQLLFALAVVLAAGQLRVQALLGQRLHRAALHRLVVLAVALHQLQAADHVVAVALAEGLLDARRQAVVKVDDGLPAVLVVLVALHRDARQRRIAGDVVRLAQRAVPRAEAALEQLEQVDLAAGRRQRQEVHVVDVDVSLAVGLRMLGLEHVHVVELLGALGAVAQHHAHGRVAVDVRVLALDVGVLGRLVGDVLIDLHQPGLHVARTRALRTVEDVGLGRAHIAVLDQHPFHQVLDLLDRRLRVVLLFLRLSHHLLRNLGAGLLVLVLARSLERLANRLGDLLAFKGHLSPVTLDDGVNHCLSRPFMQGVL